MTQVDQQAVPEKKLGAEDRERLDRLIALIDKELKRQGKSEGWLIDRLDIAMSTWRSMKNGTRRFAALDEDKHRILAEEVVGFSPFGVQILSGKSKATDTIHTASFERAWSRVVQAIAADPDFGPYLPGENVLEELPLEVKLLIGVMFDKKLPRDLIASFGTPLDSRQKPAGE